MDIDFLKEGKNANPLAVENHDGGGRTRHFKIYKKYCGAGSLCKTLCKKIISIKTINNNETK